MASNNKGEEKHNVQVLEFQKIKILMVFQILWEDTDEIAGDMSLDEDTRAKHALTREEIVEKLKAKHSGVNFNIKGVTHDLEQLGKYLIKIRRQTGGLKLVEYQRTKGHRGYLYYLVNRPLGVTDIQMLMDATDRMRFINNTKRTRLKKNLKAMAGNRIWKSYKRADYTQEEFYSTDLETETNIEMLQQAISENRKVTFDYFKWEYNGSKIEKITKHDKHYIVSPWRLMYIGGFYYIVAYSDVDKEIRHYRVDRMLDIKKLRYKREGEDAYKAVNIEDYHKKVFNMYRGEEVRVHMLITQSLVTSVVDRFGIGAKMLLTQDNRIEVIEKVELSPQFYAWVFGLGRGIEIISPRKARDGMKNYLKEIQSIYEK